MIHPDKEKSQKNAEIPVVVRVEIPRNVTTLFRGNLTTVFRDKLTTKFELRKCIEIG